MLKIYHKLNVASNALKYLLLLGHLGLHLLHKLTEAAPLGFGGICLNLIYYISTVPLYLRAVHVDQSQSLADLVNSRSGVCRGLYAALQKRIRNLTFVYTWTGWRFWVVAVASGVVVNSTLRSLKSLEAVTLVGNIFSAE
jgi:hypothetical protein